MDRFLATTLAVSVLVLGALTYVVRDRPLPPALPAVVVEPPRPPPPVPLRSPVELIPEPVRNRFDIGRSVNRSVYDRAEAFAAEKLEPRFEALRPLHELKRAPEFGDWLLFTAGGRQTVPEYLATRPSRAEGARKVIELRLIGPFTPTQQRVLELTADWLSRWYQLPVRFGAPIALDEVPVFGWRTQPSGRRQLRTTTVLERVLKPRLPPDAMAVVAFTAVDLFPDEGWNFVFGQSSFDERVAVFSVCRLGDLDASAAAFHTTLARTMKIATHELAHSFSLPHCAAYECIVNGSNGLDETDEAPLSECPICAQKLASNRRWNPVRRARDLAAFAAANGFPEERAHQEAVARALARHP